jgi:hypothetical protein
MCYKRGLSGWSLSPLGDLVENLHFKKWIGLEPLSQGVKNPLEFRKEQEWASKESQP